MLSQPSAAWVTMLLRCHTELASGKNAAILVWRYTATLEPLISLRDTLDKSQVLQVEVL